jgi:hypothetical protein
MLGFVEPELLPPGGPLVAQPWPEARKAAEAAVAANSKRDLVICLAHVSESGEEAMQAALPMCDVMAVAHEGSPLGSRMGGRPVLVRAANRGRMVGRLDLDLGPDWRTGSSVFPDPKAKKPADTRSPKAVSQLIPLERAMPDDPAVEQLVRAYQDGRRAREKAALGLKPADEARPETSGYAGVQTCGACHAAQAAQWNTTRHAHALETLKKSGHEADRECIGCHVTGWNQPGGFSEPAAVGFLANVQCEVCHGRGKAHLSDLPRHIDRAKGDAARCQKCHTGAHDPDFNYPEYLKKIIHWQTR